MFTKLIPLLTGLALLGAGLQPLAQGAPSMGPDSIRQESGSQRQENGACPPLAAPGGRIVEAADEAALWEAVNENIPNTTILVADGTYQLGQFGYYLWFDTPNVTLRSKSGNREAVIFDDAYSRSEIISVSASNVTIADLTIRRAGTHPIHVVGSDQGNTLNTRIYNVHIVDPGQQAIKINANGARTHFADGGEIACSTIELSAAGREKVMEINGSCYTGGVDGHMARGWEVRDNRIEGFWCDQGLSEHAVHFWTGSRDTLVERNVLVDNARGIGFGLLETGSARTYPDDPCPEVEGYVDHYGGIIRNNFIFAGSAQLFGSGAGFDCGVCLWQACGVKVLHNTVASTQAPFSSIEWRFPNTQAEITNNLTSHRLLARNSAGAVLAGNQEGAPLSLFTEPLAGDLHLAAGASAAIDQGSPVPGGYADEDIDGERRPGGAGPDIGADERAGPVNAPTDWLYLPLIRR
jgi:hypothetical protein